MFGSKSNVFVSLSPRYDYDQEGGRRCMRPHHVWMLTVETPKYSFPGTQQRDPNPTHYSVVWNEYIGHYELMPVSPTNLGIIGSILIQRHAPASPEKLFQKLKAGMKAHNASFPKELEDSDGSEDWVMNALQALQDDATIQEFNIDLFMTFSKAYLARRMDGEGPARIAYSRLHKDHSQKQKSNFWVSYPQRSCNYEGNVYGGLM